MPEFFSATFDKAAAFDLINALTEHVNNADAPTENIMVILATLKDQYTGDLPSGTGDPIDPDGLAAA